MKPTTVYGKIYNESGNGVPGVLLKWSLHVPYFYQGRFINNAEIRATTNSLGIFSVQLFPSTLSKESNFYYLTIYQDIRSEFRVIVPESDTMLNYAELQHSGNDEDSLIGNCC